MQYAFVLPQPLLKLVIVFVLSTAITFIQFSATADALTPYCASWEDLFE